MAKFNLFLTGFSNNTEAVLLFRDELLKYGSGFINLVTNEKEANMEIDVSGIKGIEDITKEALYVLNSVKKIQKYEKKRKRIIKTAKRNLLGSSNFDKFKKEKNEAN